MMDINIHQVYQIMQNKFFKDLMAKKNLPIILAHTLSKVA